MLPLTWELPASIALTWVLAAVLALPVGQGLACLVLRQSFAWPGPALGQSVLGLLSGERHWGGTLDDVLTWLADPHNAGLPEEILRTHPGAAPFWDGLLRGALHGDDRTAGNTITTVQQAMALFFQESIRQAALRGQVDRQPTSSA